MVHRTYVNNKTGCTALLISSMSGKWESLEITFHKNFSKMGISIQQFSLSYYIVIADTMPK